MYNDSYLIPANAKRGTLIWNIFRRIDAYIFAIGILATMFLLAINNEGNGEQFIILLVKISPAIICTLLVMPIPNYHNTLCAIQSIVSFYTERRRFLWKGWCFYEKYNEK